MMKKLLLPVLAFYLFTHSVGCTSGDVQEESDVAVSEDESFAEEGEEDFADGSEESGEEGESEGAEDGEEVADSEGDEEGGEEEGGEDEEFADSEDEGGEEGGGEEGGDEFADSEGSADEGDGEGEDVAMDEGGEELEGDEESEFPEDVAEETETTDDTSVAGTDQPTDENLFTANESGEDPAPPMDPGPPVEQASEPPPAPADDLFRSSGAIASTGGASFAPLQKIKDAPFERGGALLNRVYVSRPGDTLKAVSEKIYGSGDRAADLRKWNPGLRNSPSVGTKIYYNSPGNPTDSAQMLTFYEDKGVPPQVYTTKDGDNIRTVSKELLGSSDSWKEVWSTNMDVASKGALPAGIELKYWPEGSAPAAQPPAQTMAGTDPTATTPPPTDPMAVPPMDPGQAQANNGVPPTDPTMMPPVEDPLAGNPPPPGIAGTDPLAPPPPDPGAVPPPVAGTTDLGAPPPPDVAPPPAPEPVKPPRNRATADSMGADDDTTLMVGVAGVLLLLLVGVFVIMKKNRSRRIDLSQTQV